MVPYQALSSHGFEVDAVCPKKDGDDTVKTAVHDLWGDQTYLETRGHDFALDTSFEELTLDDYEGLVLPGGRAPEYLRGHEEVLDAVRHFDEADKPIAAICHAVQILAAADVVEGKTRTAYPALNYDVEAAGGEWTGRVVTDGHLVTAQAWPDHAEWIRQFVDVLGVEASHPDLVAADD